MNNKTTLCILIIVCVLMAAAFMAGKYNQTKTIIVPPFPVCHHDSLGVYRVCGIDKYVSKDKKTTVEVTYLQIGDNERCYSLSMTDMIGSSYGDIGYSEDGIQSGYFYTALADAPIYYYNDSDDNIYIIVNKKRIDLSYSH